MKQLLFIAIVGLAASCSSSKQSKYDFSNVESISLDAMHPSPEVVIVNKTAVVECDINDFSNARIFPLKAVENDTVTPSIKFDFSNIQSISLDAQIYNNSPSVIMSYTIIIVSPAIAPKN